MRKMPSRLVLERWYKDHTQRQIAKVFGVSQGLVGKWLRRRGIKSRPKGARLGTFSGDKHWNWQGGKTAHPDPRKKKDLHYRRRYGITLERVLKEKKKQNNRCKICRRILKNYHIDHCHSTREFRGLLCPNCNHGIGLLQDNPNVVRTAADYLEFPEGKE